jgi:ribosomal protein L32E
MKEQKFLRLGYTQYSKLGLRRKNKLKYRRAKGKDNKIRLKMKGHLRNVTIGFKNSKKTRHLIHNEIPAHIKNLNDLKNIKKGQIGIVMKMGILKKKEIATYALEKNIKLFNLNPNAFLKKFDEIKKLKQDLKGKKDQEKKIKEAEKKEEVKQDSKETIEQKLENKNPISPVDEKFLTENKGGKI